MRLYPLPAVTELVIEQSIMTHAASTFSYCHFKRVLSRHWCL